jgi:hypothetical protein
MVCVHVTFPTGETVCPGEPTGPRACHELLVNPLPDFGNACIPWPFSEPVPEVP